MELSYYTNVHSIKLWHLLESGGKRLIFLIGSNMDDSGKLPSKTLPAHDVLKTKPVEYEWNKKSWMTGKIFTKKVLKLNTKFRKKKGNILLFIDNCTAHDSIPEMKNVKSNYSRQTWRPLSNQWINTSLTISSTTIDVFWLRTFSLALLWTTTTKLQSTS